VKPSTVKNPLQQEIVEPKQAEEAIKAAHKQLSQIIEFLPDATFVIDKDKKVIAWNRAIEEMTGTPKEEIIGKGNYAYGAAFYHKPIPMLIDLLFIEHKEIEQRCDYFERKGDTLYAEIFVQSVFMGNGAHLWVKASPLYDHDGNMVGAIESIRDITGRKAMEIELRKHRDNLEDLVNKRTAELKAANEQLEREIIQRKQLEKALQKSEEKYRAIFENTGTAMTILDDDTTVIMANTEALKLAGFSKHVGSSWTEYVAPEDLERMKKYHQMRRIDENLVPKSYEFRHINKQGQVKDVLATVAMIPGTTKSVVSLLDISDRKRAEEVMRKALMESQQREAEITALLESTRSVLKYPGFKEAAQEMFHSCINLVGATSGYIMLMEDNNQYCEMPFIELGGQTCTINLPIPLLVKGIHAQVCNNGQAVYYNDFANSKWQKYIPTGHIRIENALFAPFKIDNKVVGLLALGNKPDGFNQNDVRLISVFCELVAVALHNSWTMELLKNSEERFVKAFQASPAQMAIFSVTSNKFLQVNNSFSRATGYQREEVIGRTGLELNILAIEDHYQNIKQTVLEQGFIQNLEISYRTKSGEIRTGLFSAEIIELNGEQCLLATMTDITERKLTEEAIESERRRLYSLLDGLPAYVCLLTPDYSVRFSNRNYKELFGEPDNRKCYEVIRHTEPCDGCPCRRVLNTKRPEELEKTILGHHTHKVYFYPFSDIDDSPLILALGIDITEQKRMEKEIACLDRLNLVGEMAAGIGHEVRNPMTTVRGFLQMLGEKEECTEYKQYFELMIGELDRANSIITEFLSLAKNKVIELQECNLNSIIRALSPLIEADAMRFDKYLKVKLEHIPNIALNEKEIRQLILNLTRNGLEAMSSGATLTIRTFTEDKKVVMAVEDQGSGINPDVHEKIGTPFFTTKDNGTGLGLAVCYSIAARHKASIEFETSSNGTTFFVRFNPLTRLRPN